METRNERICGARGAAWLFGSLCLLGPSTSAFGQVLVTTERAGTLLPLVRDPAASRVTPIVFSSSDDGDAQISLPFPFVFLGEVYSSARVGTNGLVVFGSGRATRAFNTGIGRSTEPNRMIAVWWDDLALPSTSGHAGTAVLGSAPNRTFVIEVRDLEDYPYNSNPELTWQLRLSEGNDGRFEVRYAGSPTERYGATIGYEGANGVPSAAFRPCGVNGNCQASDFSGLTTRIIQVAQAPGPDFTVQLGTLPPGGNPGDRLFVPISIRNVGTVGPARSFDAAVYLSMDETFDALDREVGRLTLSPIGPRRSVTRTATLTLPSNFGFGTYRVIARVDPANVVREPDETDNLDLAPGLFEVGHDLSLDRAAATVQAAAPGATLPIDMDVSQSGLPFSGPVEVVVYASSNRVLSSSDPVLGRRSITLSPGQSASLQLSGRVPSLGISRFWPLAQLDPQRQVVDRNLANQVVVGDEPVLTGPDLQVAEVNPLASGARPGTPISVQVGIENVGVPIRDLVEIRAYASNDPIWDRSDTLMGTFNYRLTAQSFERVVVPLSVPGLSPDRYFVVASVDEGNAVPEVVETNNAGVSLTPFSSAPNLSVADVSAPSVAPPGGSFSPTVRIDSDGAPWTGSAVQRWWLSTDQQLDASDIDLGTFTVFFRGDLSQTVRPSATLDPNLPQERWYVLVRADDPNRLMEADETDNLGVSRFQSDGRRNLRPSVRNFRPTLINPGDTVEIDVESTSFAAPYNGPLGYRLFLSRNTTFDALDLPVGSGTVTMSGNRFNFSATAATDANVPPGLWRVFVQLDPSDRIIESNETDNADYGFGSLTIRGPDLEPADLVAPATALAGESLDVSFTLINQGSLATASANYRYELLATGSAPRILAGAGPLPLSSLGRIQRRDRIALPGDLSGSADLFVLVDPRGELQETNEGNNRLTTPIVIIPRKSDLRPVLARASTTAAAGETWLIEWAIENRGVEPASSAVGFYLLDGSDGATRVATATVSLMPSEVALNVTRVELDADLEPGRRRLEIVADPEGALSELDETNNRLLGPEVNLLPAALRIRTPSLPAAILGRLYQQRLEAIGGARRPTWSLRPGDILPAGFSLTPDGLLGGTPGAPGRTRFTVRVESGGERAERSFVLDVREAGADLMVVTRRLDPAWVDEDYEGRLVAIGGLPPLTFRAESLPRGFELTGAGVLRGRSSVPIRSRFTVEVTDAGGASASETVGFAVLDPEQRLTITPAPLPDARQGVPYCEDGVVELFVVGGVPPIVWSGEGLPPGMRVAPEGRLCGVPTMVGAFDVRLLALDQVGESDSTTIPLSVVPRGQIVLRTASLPPVQSGASFSIQLRAEGGTEPYRFALALGALPPGAVLSPEGLLSGQVDPSGIYPFGVEIRDSFGAFRVAPLSLEVLESSDPGGGCRCGGLKPSLPSGGRMVLLGLLGLLAVGRRRRLRIESQS